MVSAMHAFVAAVVAALMITAATASITEMKFSLRNLSGGPIAVWWRQPGAGPVRKLIAQSAMSVRNSSNLQINSFEGHEFVIRRSKKGALADSTHKVGQYKEGEEAMFAVGDTNDIVIVTEALTIERRGTNYVVKMMIQDAIAECHAVAETPGASVPASCVANQTTEALREIRAEYDFETDLREKMFEKMEVLNATLGGSDSYEVPDMPKKPLMGWPSTTSIDEMSAYAAKAITSCGGDAPSVPMLPAVLHDVDLGEEYSSGAFACSDESDINGGVCANTEVARAAAEAKWAAEADGHEWCARWARIGECEKNPGYMESACAKSCEREKAAGLPPAPVDELLGAVEKVVRYEECVTTAMKPEVARLLAAVSAERNAKSSASDGLRNMTCEAMPTTTTPLISNDWTDDNDHTVGVDTLFDHNGASIRHLRGFTTEDECKLLMDNARPRLRPATVAEEGNNQARSKHRRAQAANVDADWKNPDDPITRISRRVYNITNAFTGYGLSHESQEPFSVIQYDAPEKHDGEPQEYRPHCDGSCDGSPHLHGGRVATVLIYCQVADEGGGTTFANADVFVQPRATDAVLFSYYDPKTGDMDTGLTEHSGCPVMAGTKWVITEWMRLGVGRDNPWTSSDPTGAKL
mmetsp:Transcript_90578/g.258757  ORF Transcript_90578/g.258757 Transcript_90578/m.258757 type:complete len:637 (+) Transcript_90578:219-2129(+)